MAEHAPFDGLPLGATPIVRSATTGSLYTVPAGRRLHIRAAWVASAGTTAAGTVAVTCSAIVGDANTRTIVGVAVPNSASGNTSEVVEGLDIPIPAGATVDLTLVTASGGTQLAGFYGWEEVALPGAGNL